VQKPSEFHLEEVQHGPPVKLAMTFRLSVSMDAAVQHMAWEHKCDKAVIMRHALHEYFAARGKDAWGVT
jgi:predicted transcriptional regulator